jgi:hypothetical protein
MTTTCDATCAALPATCPGCGELLAWCLHHDVKPPVCARCQETSR